MNRVLIIGAGGVGNWVARGVGRILSTERPESILLLVDGDTYEPRNADRQEFSGLGNKALVKAQELAPQLPDVYVLHDQRWVVGEESQTNEGSIKASDLLMEGDVVFATVDNHAARKDIFDAASKMENIHVFTGGNDSELFGSVYHYQRQDGKDITSHPAVYHEEFINPPDRNPGNMSCEERSHIEGGTQTLAANMLVGGYLTARFHKVIIQEQEDLEAEIMFDASLGLAQPYDRLVEDSNVLVSASK